VYLFCILNTIYEPYSTELNISIDKLYSSVAFNSSNIIMMLVSWFHEISL